MTTSKPRITITLDPNVYGVIRSISAASGQPMSAIVSDLLDSSVPILERMVQTFNQLRTMKETERAAVVKALADAEDVLSPMLMQVTGQMDLLAAAAGLGAAGTLPAVAAGPSTPSTNRGVTPTHQKPSKPSRSKALKPVSSSKLLSKKKG
jgi:hypothetical protein